jgi:multidrug efflux pump subunit AcrB
MANVTITTVQVGVSGPGLAPQLTEQEVYNAIQGALITRHGYSKVMFDDVFTIKVEG